MAINFNCYLESILLINKIDLVLTYKLSNKLTNMKQALGQFMTTNQEHILHHDKDRRHQTGDRPFLICFNDNDSAFEKVKNKRD